MPGATASSPPVKLVDGSAYGLLLLQPDASEGFLTRWGTESEGRIYHFKRGANASGPIQVDSTPAVTFTNGHPRAIEKGADGAYYVFLAEGGQANALGTALMNYVGSAAAQRFRIVKLKWDGVTLEPDHVVVDNFTDTSTESW